MADAPTTTPKQGLTAALAQASALWNKLSRGKRLAIIMTAVGVLGGVAFLSMRPDGSKWPALIERVSPEDAVELTAALDGHAIPHRFADDGATVEVPPDKLAEARVVITAAGLPHTGAGFELFDKAQLGQSSFAEQVNYRRAIEGEIARSITTLAQVEGARVHVALGRRSVIKDADEPPSASVALRLHAGQHLTADEVRGVKQLVAGSVEGLAPDSVVVVDDHGDVLGGEEHEGLADRDATEQEIAQRVRTILERVVGAGHVAVVATAEIDASKVNQTEELYDKDKTALRSESQSIEGKPPQAAIGGVAGVQGNLPGAPSPQAGSGSGGDGRLQDTRNYEVSRIVRNTVGPAARLQRIHLAVLVDEPVDAKGKPTTRSADEMAQLTSLAHEAAGLDDARGDKLEIRAVKFAPEDDKAPAPIAAPTDGSLIPWQYVELGAAGLGALFLLALIFALLRRRSPRTELTPALSLPAAVADLERMLDAAPGTSPSPALAAPKPAHDRVLDAIRADVPRAARVLSTWLGENGAAEKGAR